LRVLSIQAQVSLPDIWLPKTIVEVLVAYKLANISKKNELEWVKSHWHAKKFGDHKTNFWVMTTKFVR
jgi:hypothetical protein